MTKKKKITTIIVSSLSALLIATTIGLLVRDTNTASRLLVISRKNA